MKKQFFTLLSLSTLFSLLSPSQVFAHEADQCGLPEATNSSMMPFGIMGGSMMGNLGNGISGTGSLSWLGSIMMILFWLLIVLAIYALFKWLSTQSNSSGSNLAKGKSALDILKERFAKGEITKKEFEEMKKEIS